MCYGIFCSGQLLFLNKDIIPHKGKKLILDSSCNITRELDQDSITDHFQF